MNFLGLIFLLSVACPLHGLLTPQQNLIETMRVTKNKVTVTINKEFKRKYLKEDFFAVYDPNINLEAYDYSVRSMPFIMNVITIVWISGNTYYVDEMDTELYESLKRIKKVFQVMYPKTRWDGELIARTLVDHRGIFRGDEQTQTALLFSGGIDSTSSSFAHSDKKQLLITAWGHWDLPLNEPALWNVHKKRTLDFAQTYSHETAFIKSNYSSFLRWEYLSKITPEIVKWRLGAVEGLGWAGLTAPVLLSRGYPVLRIASSHTWLYPFPSAATPFVDNNIRFCGLRVIHDQYDMTRSAKIAFIAQTVKEKNLRKPFLKVCSYEKKNDKNCGICRKCVSTIMGFYAIGEDPKPYGMHLSLPLTCDRFFKLIAPKKLNAYTILYCKGVQQRIRERIARGEPVQKPLQALAAINFDTKVAVEDLTQEKIKWSDMHALLPELTIPDMVDGIAVVKS